MAHKNFARREMNFVENVAENTCEKFGARQLSAFPHGPETSLRQSSYMLSAANSRRHPPNLKVLLGIPTKEAMFAQ
jgi:hypothetical protein